jgi:hypothetical protein
MGTAGARITVWALIHYIKNNRFKTVESMTEEDLDELVKGFCLENTDEMTNATDNTALGAAYTSIKWPGNISAYRDRATCDQADYFEGHFKKAKYGA